MIIGSKITASSDFHDVTGIVVAGIDTDGNFTKEPGFEVDMESRFSVHCDDGEVVHCNGWLWTTLVH